MLDPSKRALPSTGSGKYKLVAVPLAAFLHLLDSVPPSSRYRLTPPPNIGSFERVGQRVLSGGFRCVMTSVASYVAVLLQS